jgi:cyclopropane-fatty-acyl-phospholipid synthase
MASVTAIGLVEQGIVPDAVSRAGIRQLIRQRIRDLNPADCETAAARSALFVEMMNAATVAPLPEKANEQHYEVPAEFFRQVLGPHAKYSCCYWDPGENDLGRAEHRALEITCDRARVEDGQQILELGCGWGSLTLFLARRYPNASITAVSNSGSQRDFIMRAARAQQLSNVEVITADMNGFDTPERFDRVVSVEMFEHMRNYRRLFHRVSGWLRPGGLFFMHIFCHRNSPYEFVDRGPSDWMSRHFFSGGIMPSDDLPLRFQEHLSLVGQWRWNGRHYEATANAWLARMDRRREHIMPVLEATYGLRDAETWWRRWRLFFMACAELFGHANGSEWWVSHYLFARRAA